MITYKVVRYFDTYPEKIIHPNLSEKEAEKIAQDLNNKNHSPNVKYIVKEVNTK